jgi:hypothetical protein
MDDVTIAGDMNLALIEAGGSARFVEHFNAVGDTLVLEYHFSALPVRLDLGRLLAAFDRVGATYWTHHAGHSAINIDGAIAGRKVSVVVSLRKEIE